MPAKSSIAPLRILPTQDAMALSHDINRMLDQLTILLNDRYGFNGPVKFHNGVDLGQNPISNVGSSTANTNAATVEQIRALQAQMAAFDAALAAFVLQTGNQAQAFTALTDSPGPYTGQVGKGVRVAAGELRLEYVTLVESILQLLDIPDSFVGQAHKILRVTADETGMEFVSSTGGGGVDNFLALLDTPDSYAGQAGKAVLVNGTATALEFGTAAGGGTVTGETGRARVFMHMGS